MSFLSQVKNALKKTSNKISLIISGKKIDKEFLEKLEETLILSDTGVEIAQKLTSIVASTKFNDTVTDVDIKRIIADEIEKILSPYESDLLINDLTENPCIMLIIGVNGNGKTTTIAKIANYLKLQGKNPLLVAGDTFRAAAVEQLNYWAEKIGLNICKGTENADPAGLVFSAIEEARLQKNDIVLIDTAGRMQNRTDLLEELEKIKRVVKKLDPSAPHKTLLIIDALTGQASHNQVEIFLNKIGVDGIIVTKLDSSAKGGALIAIAQKYNVPIVAIGIGESLDDIKIFSAKEYAEAIIGL